MLINIFTAVIIMSIAGSILALILLALRPVTRKFFSPSWQYYIWIAVLLVFMVPASFDIFPGLDDISAYESALAGAPPATSAPTGSEAAAHSQIAEAVIHIKTVVANTVAIAFSSTLTKVLSAIWLAGVLLYLLYKIFAYFAFLKNLSANSYEDFSVTGLPHRLSVKKTSMLDAPLIVGILHPTLFLPDSLKTDNSFTANEHLSFILQHELTHFRRHDLIYKWAAMFATVIHWFNPLAHIVQNQIYEECEVSCDFETTKDFSEGRKRRYMAMLLSMVSASCGKRKHLASQMASSKRLLERRFNMIQDGTNPNKKRRVISIIIALVLIIGAVSASAILAGAAEDANADNANLPVTLNNADNTFVELKWPCPSATQVSQGFSEERGHLAIDIIAEEGADVISSISGTVVETGYDKQKGNYVIISDGTVTTVYAQLSHIHTLIAGTDANGQRASVKAGDVIAKVGKTGMATGPHLHFEILMDGKSIDPATIFEISVPVSPFEKPIQE